MQAIQNILSSRLNGYSLTTIEEAFSESQDFEKRHYTYWPAFKAQELNRGKTAKMDFLDT